jgi:hypothetical protein
VDDVRDRESGLTFLVACATDVAHAFMFPGLPIKSLEYLAARSPSAGTLVDSAAMEDRDIGDTSQKGFPAVTLERETLYVSVRPDDRPEKTDGCSTRMVDTRIGSAGNTTEKNLREPINVVIVDRYSADIFAAIKKIMMACKTAGYSEEFGHSSGYCAEIGGKLYKQIPNDKYMAFASKDFSVTNNHGRIMGPAIYKDAFIFVAGFCTERPIVLKGFEHLFVSFNRARDDFCMKMNARCLYTISGKLFLGNTIDAFDMTTADHNGAAIVLSAVE